MKGDLHLGEALDHLAHAPDDDDNGGFKRRLGLLDLTVMGVGGTIGAGIFVLTGVAAATYAGPAVTIAYLVAAVVCACAGLCYAELASMTPKAGSAYLYARASLGEVVAWIVGWNLILEYMFSASTVAVGWSGYFNSMLTLVGVHVPEVLNGAPITCVSGGCELNGNWVNAPATLIVLAVMWLLLVGTRMSANAVGVVTLVKVAVIALVVGFGAPHIDATNFEPYIPPNTGEYGEFGWSGVMRAAGLLFFAYVGFDQVSSCAQEAKHPQRDIPLALLFSLIACTALYVAMAVVMTGLAPYTELNVSNPTFVAIDAVGQALAWLKPFVAVGVVVGLFAAVLMSCYGQTRIFYAMARDGLFPKFFAKVDRRSGVPVDATLFTGLMAALIAGFTPLQVLGELISIGTLLAFAIVCVGVLALRISKPGAARRFRAPLVFVVAPAGVLSCLYLMFSLPGDTWLRFWIWLALGAIGYFIVLLHRRSKRPQRR